MVHMGTFNTFGLNSFCLSRFSFSLFVESFAVAPLFFIIFSTETFLFWLFVTLLFGSYLSSATLLNVILGHDVDTTPSPPREGGLAIAPFTTRDAPIIVPGCVMHVCVSFSFISVSHKFDE